jgi:glycosyltransferase involved in cell wall biosynthesis
LQPRNDLLEVMTTADAFVTVSFYEPFGSAVLEAMASGTAVIASRNVGVSSPVGEARIVIADPLDAPGLARAISELASHPPETARRGQAGRSNALICPLRAMAEAYVNAHDAHRGASVAVIGVEAL